MHLVTRLLNRASQFVGLPVQEIVSPRRGPDVHKARCAVALVAYETGSVSSTGLGQRLGGRDHATALHAIKRAKVFLEEDPFFPPLVDALRQELRREL